MTTRRTSKSRVRTYLDEKSALIADMEKVVTDVVQTMDDDVQDVLRTFPGVNNLSELISLHSALEIARGNPADHIPIAAHGKLRAAISYYTQNFDGRMDTDYSSQEFDETLKEILHTEFVMSAWKDKVRRKFRVPLTQNIQMSKILLGTKIGLNTYARVDEWTQVTIPLANSLDLIDLREFALLFNDAWSEILDAAKWRRDWFTDNA